MTEDAPADAATELAPSVTETEAVTAWALDNPEGVSPQLMAVYDRQFVANMQPHMQAVGSSVEDADLMAFRAHQTCAKLQQGYTDGSLAQQLMTEFGLVPSLANAFVRTAMAT